MRDALAFNMLPIVEESVTVFRGLNAISSNGYYGYQPSLAAENHIGNNNKRDPVSSEIMEVDHLNPSEDISRRNRQHQHDHHSQPATWNQECYHHHREPANRKRSWEFSAGEDLHQFKKRRENDEICDDDDTTRRKGSNSSLLGGATNTDCSSDELLYEDILRETHGCAMYHWIRSSSDL